MPRRGGILRGTRTAAGLPRLDEREPPGVVSRAVSSREGCAGRGQAKSATSSRGRLPRPRASSGSRTLAPVRQLWPSMVLEQICAHDELALAGAALQPRGDVDGVAERGEVDDGGADVADIGLPGVEPDAERQPRARGAAVADRLAAAHAPPPARAAGSRVRRRRG